MDAHYNDAVNHQYEYDDLGAARHQHKSVERSGRPGSATAKLLRPASSLKNANNICKSLNLKEIKSSK